MVYNQPPLDSVFQALADPTRRAIVGRLAKGEATVSSLAAPFATSLPAVMKHIAVLEKAAIVVRSKSGRTVTCSLEPRSLIAARLWLEEAEHFWSERLDALRQLVEESPWPNPKQSLPPKSPHGPVSRSSATSRRRSRRSSAPGPSRKR